MEVSHQSGASKISKMTGMFARARHYVSLKKSSYYIQYSDMSILDILLDNMDQSISY